MDFKKEIILDEKLNPNWENQISKSYIQIIKGFGTIENLKETIDTFKQQGFIFY